MRVLARAEGRPFVAFPRQLPALDALLGTGGDHRLALDAATSLNIYGCSRAPRPQAVAFSSSTASTISARAWRRAARIHHRLARGDDYDELVEAARGELARVLGLAESGAAIVFAPSGTDAMLHALAVARARLGTPIASILAASDETGSGAPFAAAGRHFARTTARGSSVTPGEPIAGLADGVELVQVPLRDAAGAVRDSDIAILGAVAAARAAGKSVVLFAMDHSKLGNRAPSDACLAEIEAAHRGAVQVVVDACQARLGRARLAAHLARGRMVLVTGSKFFGGPPLSGALLLPAELADAPLPPGLADYAVASDWPRTCRVARKTLEAGRNFGQLLRWTAALAEIEAWSAAPLLRRQAALRDFGLSVARAMAGCAEVALLDWPDAGDAEFPAPTIVPFLVRRDGADLGPAQCGKLYRALNQDVSDALPSLAGAERGLAQIPCHIGQPVAVAGLGGSRGALRISAGARILTETGQDNDTALALIFAKIGLLVRNFSAIERAF